jgi:hypothetical protein
MEVTDTVHQPDPASVKQAAMARIAATATHWLTTDTVTAIGQDMTATISRHPRTTGQQPTWAEALTGVNPDLLTPITTVPDNWPLPAAVWRRELRGRLMGRLTFTRWITYTTAPRSLRVGTRGQAWLTAARRPVEASGAESGRHANGADHEPRAVGSSSPGTTQSASSSLISTPRSAAAYS